MIAGDSNRGTKTPLELLQRALACIQAGQLSQAQSLCREVLAREPRNFNAWQLLGHTALQSADYASAVQWLTTARSINPGNSPVHSNLAVALLALRRSVEALACCDQAIALTPGFPEAHNNRGNALRALGRFGEALASYDRAVSAVPQFFDAHVGRTAALLALKRFSDALEGCDRVLQLNSRSLDAWILRGNVLLTAKRPQEAMAAFDRALELHPESAEAHNNRGTALRDLKHPGDALAAYQCALSLRPQFAEVYCNIANVGLDWGRYEEAIEHCNRALRIQPDLLEALNIRGTALGLLKRFADAASTYETILRLSPSYGHARSHLLVARASLGDWTERSAHADQITSRVVEGHCASSPHAFLWICDSAPAQFQCATLFSAVEYPPIPPLWRGEIYGHARLRIAYLSADFTDHPVAHLIAAVLEGHDRQRFETYGVSLCKDPMPGLMHRRMQNAFEHFLDVSDWGDREVAQRLHELKIDIAVDLTCHTRGGRLGILACRPAPIQINYLGYTGTSGTDFMDYLIADIVAIPAGLEDSFSERIVYMPHSFLPNDSGQGISEHAPLRREMGLPEAGFVFCAFNTTYKIGPDMFDVWMRLLKQTTGSVLWLRAAQDAVRDNLRREAESRGMDPARLVFAPRIQEMDQHLSRYRQADLFLDTLPYGAHATARDALWAGLPVLTVAGNSFAGRVAASLLATLGLPELVATSLEDYESRALALAHSPLRLSELRAKLAHERHMSPLFDTHGYRRHLESAYVAICESQRRGEPPRTFKVVDRL